MGECEPYFPPAPTGEHIRAFLLDPKRDVREALKELHQLGWRKDQTRSEPVPRDMAALYGGRKEVRPWWFSPTGESVRGLKAAMRAAIRALDGLQPTPPPKPEPSPMAQRILEALERHPELREELRTLLR